MTTNDHTVPQFYLRRFARTGRGKNPQLVAAPVDDLSATFVTSPRNVAAVKGFHWGTDPEGVPHHTMETLMTAIETAAAPAFSTVLDTNWALPQRWPPAHDDRVRLSWWVAAQILRTKRQRHRLDYLASDAAEDPGNTDVNEPPRGAVRNFARNNPHLTFITTHLMPLARIIGGKPWGIGFSDACLPTSDVPVVLINGQDDDRQLLSAAYWDVIVPLDSHRFLIMPRRGSQPDPATWSDHRLKLPGGLGNFIADLIRSAAEDHVFWHPDHEPPEFQTRPEHTRRLPRPWAGDDPDSEPSSLIRYGALPPDFTVERRWLTEHPPPRSQPDRDPSEGPAPGEEEGSADGPPPEPGDH